MTFPSYTRVSLKILTRYCIFSVHKDYIMHFHLCLVILRICNRICMAVIKYGLWSLALQTTVLCIPVCRMGKESISLLFLACRDRFAVNSIWAEAQSSMLFHLPRDCQPYTTELLIDSEIGKHTHAHKLIFKNYGILYNTTARKQYC